MDGNTEKTAGTNLTTVTEYTDTALALAELQSRFKNLVVDLSTPKGLKAAKADVAELRTLRTSLDKKREELVKPALERQRLVNAEAKRLTAEIVALEDPLKLQVDAKEAEIENARLQKLETERVRVETLQAKIDAIRNVPASLVGKPSVIIAGQLAKLEAEQLDEDEFAEFFVTARDALEAAIARVKQQLIDQQAHEAEQKRIAAERAELEKLRAEAEARHIADEERAAAERTEADRKAQAERDRIAAEERAREESERAERERLEAIERGKQMEAAAAERDRLAAERKKAEAELEAERNRQIEVQRKLDEQAEQLRKEKAAAAKKAEAERLANLGLREAAITVVNYFQSDDFKLTGGIVPRCVVDLDVALANDAAQAKPAKKAAA